jgi:lipopolysaccharide/colanic/teichoic acid biosynthesis glycosyltransferase
VSSHRDKSTGKHDVAAVAQDVPLPLELSERAKRICDLGASVAGLILLSPIFLITALAIRLESQGPVFVHELEFVHKNRSIRRTKFRVVACANGSRARQQVTYSGQILSQTGIDELPQLLNVIRGDISIVGRRNILRWPTPASWRARQSD